MSRIMLPHFKNLKGGWGQLEKDESSRRTMMNSLENFVLVLSNARESINERVALRPCTEIDLKRIRLPTDCMSIVNNTEQLTKVEQCVALWLKQIEQVN